MSSFHFPRRSLRKAAGATLALPWLEAFDGEALPARLPPRFVALYVPFGVVVEEWHPRETGADYQVRGSLEPLAKLKPEFSVVTGLQHIAARTTNHWVLDTFLTGANVNAKGSYQNRQSLDQLIADRIGDNSYVKSLVLSTAGGIGQPNLSQTLSFNRDGLPIPAENVPRQIFDQLFPPADPAKRAHLLSRVQQQRSILDLLGGATRSFTEQLGVEDRRRLDQYLTSVREVESDIQNRERILGAPTTVDLGELDLDVNPKQRQAYVRTMLGLIHLGLRSGMTNVATYAISDETNNTLAEYPEFGVKNWHGAVHARNGGPKSAGYAEAARQNALIDRWQCEQLAWFIQLLKDTKEGDSTLLDRTFVLYGSGNSTIHEHKDLPLILAGGRAFGLRHGQHVRRKPGSTPFANLFMTVLKQSGIDEKSFADSNGVITELVS